jgi:hypothetical protein
MDNRTPFSQLDPLDSVDAASLTGSDISAYDEQADVVGDKAVGGTAMTPDMDVVDELGKAVGLEMNDSNALHTTDILERRDEQRWELEPSSAEDYENWQDPENLDQ